MRVVENKRESFLLLIVGHSHEEKKRRREQITETGVWSITL